MRRLTLIDWLLIGAIVVAAILVFLWSYLNGEVSQ